MHVEVLILKNLYSYYIIMFCTRTDRAIEPLNGPPSMVDTANGSTTNSNAAADDRIVAFSNSDTQRLVSYF